MDTLLFVLLLPQPALGCKYHPWRQVLRVDSWLPAAVCWPQPNAQFNSLDPVIVNYLLLLLPSFLTLLGVVATLLVINYLIRRNVTGEISISHQVLMLVLTAAGVLIVIFSLPISETSRGQILSLLGIVVTAVIALSSTTFVANVMAGLMLRAVNSFRPGDFIRSATFFGRVTERGIFHTEIQTEDRDLMTLPNMYLVNNPITVVHDSGTIISATLSLGYDVPHEQIETLLNEAAERCGLDEPFTLVMELNDFSVTYRVGGFSTEVNRLLSTKSSLRRHILSILHENGIEIVSPNFMNQRVLAPDQKMIPPLTQKQAGTRPVDTPEDRSPEDVIFDKADTAAEREGLKKEMAEALERLKALEAELKSAEDAMKDRLTRERENLAGRVDEIKALIAAEPSPED